ncbi:MAG: PepSY domain-containing protein, partial [Gammaproteobacteria bacterium]
MQNHYEYEAYTIGRRHMNPSGPLPAQTALYRAVWRWHFVAGLFALPFLLNLAITGGLYLFAPEINHILYRSLEDVPARAKPLPASVLAQKTAEATQADVLSLTVPSEPDKSV